MTSFTFDIRPSVRFGFGLLDRTGESAAPLLRARILIVTDPGTMATAMPGRAESGLRAMASGAMNQARLMNTARNATLGIYETAC
ncbi:iron-containing alcohol dehydrogenase [Oceaniovalibus sp. ACAM 378]|uniref:iron-containing alcohol dehydrogenase n=1 Tax=Oceaniovalibus sp. ACAM 378 TaxID=2599923 RepID=UPI0011DBE1DD|nr:iron-containing alcohol dehydrogenase [Oceaniovalibus sp. ACAM 378]TYB85796.1 iron-containing alcohol dehydrogenase [Oceaniovalibus sp. ACAM 378]